MQRLMIESGFNPNLPPPDCYSLFSYVKLFQLIESHIERKLHP